MSRFDDIWYLAPDREGCARNAYDTDLWRTLQNVIAHDKHGRTSATNADMDRLPVPMARAVSRHVVGHLKLGTESERASLILLAGIFAVLDKTR